ncbi:hypothetical protein MicloDRAFT_00002590 [Microvirga lotononidis]|uniref:Glutamine synthetase n=1 Tax=Microvirga lotononidis TaxID=864069 RepID=I4Z4X7_9HYPH|nr:hypothetical protein MicloDRAFT_00002590 [Microvirga lotononidis]
MQPRQVNTIEDARQILKDRDLSHVKVGVIDLDGIVRGKYMSRDKFFSALESGFNLCEVIFGWDSSDQLYPNAQFIPTPIDQNPCAQSRRPMDMMVQG